MISAIGLERRPASRLRLVPRLRHPVHGRLGEATHEGEGDVRVRGRVRSRRLPDPRAPHQEGGGDAHILLVDKDSCRLYELYDARGSGGSWKAGSGAIWNLRSTACAPTRGRRDAAGLPILPGLVRYDEVAAGVIRHALRFTASRTTKAHIYPARHDAGDSDASLPPMGLRVRLKPSVDISRLRQAGARRLRALKTYGMILADNGSPWYISGASNKRFDDDVLHALGKITGADFEVVDTSRLRNG